jgi:hypothetical protein
LIKAAQAPFAKFLWHTHNPDSHPHSRVRLADMRRSLRRITDGLQYEFSRPSLASSPLLELAHGIIGRDTWYLSEGRPRNPLPEGTIPNPHSDPYFSHFIHYGLAGRATGMQEFDHLYQEVVNVVRENCTSTSPFLPLRWGDLSKLFGLYEERHPDSAEVQRIHQFTAELQLPRA